MKTALAFAGVIVLASLARSTTAQSLAAARERDPKRVEALEGRASLLGIDPDALAGTPAPRPLPAGQVNDPKRDLLYSEFDGYDQATTSTAWCAPNVVTVYGDMRGRALATIGIGAEVDVSYSYSHNSGASFVEGARLDALGEDVQADATVACTDPLTFYIAAQVQDAIAILKSTDGGRTFQFERFVTDTATALSQPWIVADPSDATHQRLYLAAVRPPINTPGCGNQSEDDLWVSRSTDGGNTWQLQGTIGNCLVSGRRLSGVSLAVATNGTLELGFQSYAASGPFSFDVGAFQSTDGGRTFAFSGVMPNLTPPGEAGFLQFGTGTNFAFVLPYLQGGLRPRLGRPMIAVDRSGRPGFDGNVYYVYEAGSNAIAESAAPDIPPGTYTFSDVYLMRSTDGGGSFQGPVRVNQNVEPIPPPSPYAGRGTDQFEPSVAVDRTGAVAVCWYDRRNDPGNMLIDRYCARSLDAGVTWGESRKTTVSSPPLQNFTLGGFSAGGDTLTSDFTRKLTGFRGARVDTTGGEADVKMTIF